VSVFGGPGNHRNRSGGLSALGALVWQDVKEVAWPTAVVWILCSWWMQR
jgi:hypothetical protein